MKLGMPILFEYDSIEENIKLAKELNLDFIELNLNFGYCRYEMENNKQLGSLLKEASLETTIHFYDEADMASYEEVFEGYFKLLKKYLKYTKGLNTKLLNVHLNEGPVVTISGEKNYIYDKEFDKYIEYLIQNLRKMEKECNKYNIQMVIENITIPPYLEKTYKRLIQEGFKFNYDIGHDHTSNDVLKKIAKENEIKFLEFHVHDSTETKCHLEIGQGNLDINYYMNLAKDSYVVLEVKSSSDLKNSVKNIKEVVNN